jgi:hypothetical protein
MLANTRHTDAELGARDQPGESLRKRVSLRRRVVLVISTVAVFGTLVGSSSAAVAPSSAAVGSSSGAQGIIMRDGGVCDPIRHMGC